MENNVDIWLHTNGVTRWRNTIRAFCVFLLAVVSLPFQSFQVITAAGPVRPALPDVATTTSGWVFRDLNFNGQRDGTEPGIEGATVSAYNTAGALVASSQTLSDGLYHLNSLTLAVPLRLEVTGLPAGFFASRFQPASNDSGTLVRFITQLGNGNSFAVVNPTDYCNINPRIATNCFVFGNAANGPYKNLATITAFNYNAGTTSTNSNLGVLDPVARSVHVSMTLVGSTWGLAYQRETATLFASAFTKRSAGFGPGGTGAIYQINPTLNTASRLADLNTLSATGTGVDPHDLNNFFADNPTWDKVGKTSLGGLDLSDDGETLWVMNLFDRRLYRLPVGIPASPPAANTVTSIDMPEPADCVLHPLTPAGQRNLNVRPFAVKALGDKVFVGLVCTAESSQLSKDLRAYVYRFDVNTGAFTQIANFALNYPRGCASGYSECNSASWNPWSPTERANLFYQFQEFDYAQPMLSDIEFDDAGNMIVALGDRFGHQSGEERKDIGGPPALDGAPAGDVLKLAPAPALYQLENNAQLSGGTATAGKNNGQGPGGGEFYYVDTFPIGILNVGFHQELATGGLAVLPNSGEVVVSAYNPTPLFEDVNGRSTFRSVGPLWFNNTTGARTRSHMLIEYVEPGYFTKATGMGDVELMCDSAPIEIGNRVWIDTNANGVQDPQEPPVPGVTVRLYPVSGAQVSATPLATTTTDAQGRYYFSSAGPDHIQFTADDLGNYGPDRLANTADDVNLPGLKPSTARIINRYAIRLDNQQNYFTGELLDNLAPTVPHVNSGPNSDERDSDAVRVNGYAQITFATGHAGQNNFALDFGFAFPAKLSGRAWVDGDHNGVRANSDAIITGSLVTLNGPGTLVLTTTTDANGDYTFSYLPPGNYTATFAVPQGYTFTYPLIGDPAFDSDVVQANGAANAIKLVSFDDKRNVDAGFWKPGPAIDVQALTNGDDADTLTGPLVNYNSLITWTYRVANSGDITLSSILVRDDRLGVIACPTFTLGLGQNMVCERYGLAAGGQYTNVASATSTDLVTLHPITDTDLSHHFGLVTATVQIKKYTNGLDARTAPGPTLIVGLPVTWTYVVTNTGNVPFNSVSIVDDKEGPVACANYDVPVSQSITCVRGGTVGSGAYENRAVVTASYNVPNVRGDVSASDVSHYTGYAPASVGDFVWFDRNHDGIYASGELPLAGVNVTLLSLSSNTETAIATTKTNGDGLYSFKNLLPGNYAVIFKLLPGYRFTLPGVGDPTTNSDADPTTGRTAAFALAAGEANTSLDAGMDTELPRVSIRVTTNGVEPDGPPGPLLLVGTPVEWTYIIQNTGEITLTQISVIDSKVGPINCTSMVLPPAQTLTCSQLGTVLAGPYTNTTVVTATAAGAAEGETGPQGPAAVITASATSYYVGGQAGLALQQGANPAPGTNLQKQGLVTYTLTALNTGTFTATGVLVTDVVPSEMRFIAASSGVLVVTGTNGTELRWTIGSLGLRQNQPVSFTAMVVNPATDTQYANVGFVWGNQVVSTRSNSVTHQFKVTAVTLLNFSATPQAAGMALEWRTAAEVNTFGFMLYRSATAQRDQATLLSNIIPAEGVNTRYRYLDVDGVTSSYYWLVEVDRVGAMTEFGPIRAPVVAAPSPVLATSGEVAGGVPVAGVAIVPNIALASDNQEIVKQPLFVQPNAAAAQQQQQQIVGVQTGPIPKTEKLAEATSNTIDPPQPASVSVSAESTPVAVQPGPVVESSQANLPQPTSKPASALPPADVAQPVMQQDNAGAAAAVGASARTSERAVVSAVAPASIDVPKDVPKKPAPAPFVNWIVIISGVLLALLGAAASILLLLIRNLRRR